MANLSAAVRQVRRARERVDGPRSRNFEEYRPAYEAILGAIEDLGGDPAFDELTAWLVATTRERRQLPPPAEVRRRARTICAARGIAVPPDSPLRG